MYKFDEKLLVTAVERWGLQNQLNQLQEECCELSTAISHHRRRNSDITTRNLLEEIGDVSLLLAQMRIIFGDELVDVYCAASASKLSTRIACLP